MSTQQPVNIGPMPRVVRLQEISEADAEGVERKTVKERPILFSGPMVRAILEGRKTQTRRVVKPYPLAFADRFEPCPFRGYGLLGQWAQMDMREHTICGLPGRKYGSQGDLLWVKETWSWSGEICNHEEVIWRADRDYTLIERGGHRWRPSIHMPRWASRITLEIESVRVERLQDITEADAIAEGVERNEGDDPWTHADGWIKYPFDLHAEDFPAVTAKESYQSLWQSINGPGSWDANPWVWVIQFRRVKP